MEYEIWENGGTEPVSTHETRREAEEALAELTEAGVAERELTIRTSMAGTGQVFPNGVTLHMPGK